MVIMTCHHLVIIRSLVSARRGLILGGAASVLGWSVILCAALVSEQETRKLVIAETEALLDSENICQ